MISTSAPWTVTITPSPAQAPPNTPVDFLIKSTASDTLICIPRSYQIDPTGKTINEKPISPRPIQVDSGKETRFEKVAIFEETFYVVRCFSVSSPEVGYDFPVKLSID